MKRKESLASPVKQKKARESLDAAASPAPVKSSIEEQRKRAKEWAENEAKKAAAPEESTSGKAKRSATPGKQAAAKKSKIVYDSDHEEPVEPRPSRSRKSLVPVAAEVARVLEKAATRKTPPSTKKAQPPATEESDEESAPEPVPVPPKSARKTPAKAAKAEASAKVKTPQSVPKPAKATTPKVATPKTASPVPAASRSPVASPALTSPAVPWSQENEGPAKFVERHYSTYGKPGQSLEPPAGSMVLMLQAYILVAGVAYFDLRLGGVLFFAVTVLANCVL